MSEVLQEYPSKVTIRLLRASSTRYDLLDVLRTESVIRALVYAGSWEAASGSSSSSACRKCDVVADACNRLLEELVLVAAKGEEVYHYFDLGVIGYGPVVGPAWNLGPDLVPIDIVADSPAREEERTKSVSDGAGGVVEKTIKFPVWLEAVADNGTPMCAALDAARSLLETWIQTHDDSYPPIVLNLTDGESTDGDPSELAGRIQGLATSDGNALVFNLHVSSSPGSPTAFPDASATLPDEYARLLFSISSPLPPGMVAYGKGQELPITDGSRGFVFNADVVTVVRFLDVGTAVGLE